MAGTLFSMAAWRGVTRRHGNDRHRHLVRPSLNLLTSRSFCFLLMRLLGGDWAMEGCGNVLFGLQMQQAWPWKVIRRKERGEGVREGERGNEIKIEVEGRASRKIKKGGGRKCCRHVFGPSKTLPTLPRFYFSAFIKKNKIILEFNL